MADPTQMPVFSLMKARLQMLGERQKVIAQNVANVSTPGYVPNDINQEAFSATMQRMAGQGAGAAVPGRTAMVATQAGHMAPPATSGGNVMATTKTPDSETTLDGNAVVVEEQMMKIAETRMDFETMVGLYQKSLGLLRLASRTPR
ncbi:MAG: flagellar biosynthesis protein FlgB [Alphaproteobacteria bacterium]|jgi:flagellar basal-body rod protein FlgB|nr:MAG: flagellar biosynthesis protein FlgB [Alphaproteobacteria bacterium]